MPADQDRIETQEQWLSVVTDAEIIVDEETGRASLAICKTPIKAIVLVGEEDEWEEIG